MDFTYLTASEPSAAERGLRCFKNKLPPPPNTHTHLVLPLGIYLGSTSQACSFHLSTLLLQIYPFTILLSLHATLLRELLAHLFPCNTYLAQFYTCLRPAIDSKTKEGQSYRLSAYSGLEMIRYSP